jgi:predicted nicotinamide N-methyase
LELKCFSPCGNKETTNHDEGTTNHDESIMTPGNSTDKNCMGDVFWREYNVHNIEEDVDQDEQASMFQIFQEEEPLEMIDVSFAHLPPIQVRCQEDYTQSTGMALWLGAENLTRWLVEENPDLVKDKKVLEVGAGVGLCGIAAFHLKASKVVLTDGDLDVLTNLRYNVEHNIITTNNNREEHICCQQLIWGKNLQEFQATHGQFDIVLGTDLFYMARSLKPLFTTVDQLLTKQGIFIACNVCANQHPMESILNSIEELGFRGTQAATDVYLFRRKEKMTKD